MSSTNLELEMDDERERVTRRATIWEARCIPRTMAMPWTSTLWITDSPHDLRAVILAKRPKEIRSERDDEIKACAIIVEKPDIKLRIATKKRYDCR